ncbi:MAG: hypothetical protein JXR96_19595 [Deltaproteobacteria bacterium]|nr:hypothetical protein [Deltaproteobacteria bacterium]
MLEFMRAGGYAMWLILVFGGGTIGLCVAFAWRPGERKLAMIRPLSLCTVFAVLSGMTAGLGMVMKNVTTRPEWAHSPDLHLIVMTGIGESLTPAILGFSMLCVAWLLVAVGMRRQIA